jgi:hypothetical protein
MKNHDNDVQTNVMLVLGSSSDVEGTHEAIRIIIG